MKQNRGIPWATQAEVELALGYGAQVVKKENKQGIRTMKKNQMNKNQKEVDKLPSESYGDFRSKVASLNDAIAKKNQKQKEVTSCQESVAEAAEALAGGLVEDLGRDVAHQILVSLAALLGERIE